MKTVPAVQWKEIRCPRLMPHKAYVLRLVIVRRDYVASQPKLIILSRITDKILQFSHECDSQPFSESAHVADGIYRCFVIMITVYISGF